MRNAVLASIWLLPATLASCGMSMTPEDASLVIPNPPCRYASNCAPGRACVAGLCVGTMPCTSSRVCAGLVCDVPGGVCVECLGDTDCTSNARCRAHVCLPTIACGSDRDCSAMAEVCDTGERVCVECNVDGDCPRSLLCASDHACVPARSDAGVDLDAAPMPDDASTDAGIAPSDDAGADAARDAFGLDAFAQDASVNDAGSVNDSGVVSLPGSWELVAAGGGVHYPGYSDGAPGVMDFFALTGSATPDYGIYDTALGTWTHPAGPSPALGIEAYFASPAYFGAYLVAITGTSVWICDNPVGNPMWRTVATGVAMTTRSQTTHENTLRAYAVTDDGRLAIWGGTTVTYQSLGLATPSQVARITWMDDTSRLYVVPDVDRRAMYEVTPITGPVRALTPIPEPFFTPTFCGDNRDRYLYAAGDNHGTTIWRYDVRTDVWRPLPPLPFDHDANGSCTVTYDGWLYVTENGTRLARIRVR